jgi:predicted nucleic acid-binding protein
VSVLAHAAILAPDAPTSAGRSADPGDDYLLGLAEAARAVLVSGDRHLLKLADELPIQDARTFLEALKKS